MATKNLYILDANGETSIVGGDADGRASDALKLGGKAPEYYIQPRNLLDNSDFANPVNQRMYVSGSVGEAEYSIDRWLLAYDTYLHLESNSIALSGKWVLGQCVPVKLYAGKTYTIAAMIKGENGTESAFIGLYDIVNYTHAAIEQKNDIGVDWSLIIKTFTIPTDYEIGNAQIDIGIKIGVKQTSKTYFKWVALYEGSYTADTLPPYVPKGYAVELNECKRYYYQTWYDTKISENGIVMTIAGSTTSSHTFQLPVEMRITPTITLYSFTDGTANAVVPWGGSTLANVVASNVCNRNFRIQSTGSKFTANKSYAFHFCASADL